MAMLKKSFARNQLLHDEHLTAAALGIDINKEGFLKKIVMPKSLPTKTNWHQL